MHNRTVLIFGIVLIAAGVLVLLGNLFQFNAWDYFWPLALIGLGIWFLFKPQLTTSRFLFIGDIKRQGAWQVTGEEFVTFIGDIDLDLTEAVLPAGETTLVCSGFVSDVTIITPPAVGVKVTSTAFVSDMKFLGQKTTHFLNSATQTTPGYEFAVNKVHLQARYFVGDVKVKPG